MYVASELILLGSHHRWGLLAAGGALALGALALSLWMSLAGGEQGPRPRWFVWPVVGVAFAYVVAGVAASRLGPTWAAGALAAGVIPLTAVSLLLATVRAKTVQTESGLRDASGAGEDPYAGIGLDDATPLGDTSEHSEVQEDPGPPSRFAPPPRHRLTRRPTGEVRNSPTQRRSSR
jgi:hypothetical protein